MPKVKSCSNVPDVALRVLAAEVPVAEDDAPEPVAVAVAVPVPVDFKLAFPVEAEESVALTEW
jgi:hypothetical protein